MNLQTTHDIEAAENVVAIGASAGGLEALEALFDHLAPDLGAAYVVITHLSPDFKSIMDELLARRTAMSVHVVEDGERLAGDNVYVIPPGKDMIVQGGRLFLTDREGHGAPSAPIDLFLESLARAYGANAIAVILSGTGADGAKGARALRAAGGRVIAQKPETARFDGMPRAAADKGGADLVLEPEAIGPAIGDRLHGLAATPAPAAEGADAVIARILERVLGGADIDFSEYKKTTVLRRIAKRMNMLSVATLEDYLAVIDRDPSETRALAEDLLIVVSEFFRDPPAFELIERTVAPELLARAEEDRPIRVWVPGVGAGQEAFSIAMLLREAARREGVEPRAQIFATDISPAALERAATGVYSEAEMAGVASERRERFFEPAEEGGWRVGPELRAMIVFAQHNMLRDPPFINTDLISCRNALIYLEPSAQNKALSLFHFSLTANGWLLLGPSESVGEDAGRFEPVDARWRLFRKRGAERPGAATMGALIAGGRRATEIMARARPSGPGAGRGPNAAALQALLEIYAPPGLLVGPDRELLHVVGAASRRLTPPPSGPFTRDVARMVGPALRAPLSTAIERAARSGEAVAFTAGDGDEALTLSAHPLPGPDGAPGARVYVAFGPAPEGAAAASSQSFDRAAEQRIAYLEDALRIERENLQAMLEQLETSNEELQSTNEELMTANEELQSTNEELHSVNEELYTVNAEYERKNIELAQLSKDVSSLLQATGVGVVFVERDLTLRRFTPMATRVVNLIAGDEGRRLDHFTHQFGGFDLCGWLRGAMEAGEVAEVERTAADDALWTLRAAPVREGRDVSGAVLSLIDVSRVAQAEAELERLLDWAGAVALRFDGEGRLRDALGDWAGFTGQGVGALRGDDGARWLEMVHPDDRAAVGEAWCDAHGARRGFRATARMARGDGGWRRVAIEGAPERAAEGLKGWRLYVRETDADAASSG